MNRTSRAKFLRICAHASVSFFLMRAGLTPGVFGKEIEPVIRQWREELESYRSDLRKHNLSPVEWQERMERLYTRIPLQDILAYIHFKSLAAVLDIPEKGAAYQPVVFPKSKEIPNRVGRGHKIFGLQKGAAIIPHGHNNMVSAHLVLKGKFRVRTFNRRFDLEDEKSFLNIEPVRDETMEPGQLLTMSDDRENIHWLVAESETAFTLELPITDLYQKKKYIHDGNLYSMIFVDPEAPADQKGIIRAPIIDLETSMARFG